jgi:ferric-dicitrate binding protein FerR (iron transport regulator)
VKKRINLANCLDPLIRDALAWVLLLKSGEATLADAERLTDWRTKSPAHERAYRDAVKYWQAIGRGLVRDRPSGQSRRRRKTDSTSLS